MRTSIGLTFALVFYSQLALATPFQATSEQSCSKIDFRESFPMKIRDQKNISWCFAHDAADYLQFTFRIPEQISAADIAISYSESNVAKFVGFFKRIINPSIRKGPEQTGFIEHAVKKIIPEGYCPESVFPSETWTRVNLQTQSMEQVNIIDAILDLFALREKIKNKEILSAAELPWTYALKNMNPEKFFTLLETHRRHKILPALRTMVCKDDRKAFPTHPVQMKFAIRSGKTFKNINKNFDLGMPTSIDFFEGILENYDHYKKSIDDLHTVLIYGRKYDYEKKECIYLMKNSYGESCDRYDPKIKCEAGYLWLPEQNLYRSMTSYFRMKRQ